MATRREAKTKQPKKLPRSIALLERGLRTGEDYAEWERAVLEDLCMRRISQRELARMEKLAFLQLEEAEAD